MVAASENRPYVDPGSRQYRLLSLLPLLDQPGHVVVDPPVDVLGDLVRRRALEGAFAVEGELVVVHLERGVHHSPGTADRPRGE